MSLFRKGLNPVKKGAKRELDNNITIAKSYEKTVYSGKLKGWRGACSYKNPEGKRVYFCIGFLHSQLDTLHTSNPHQMRDPPPHPVFVVAGRGLFRRRCGRDFD